MIYAVSADTQPLPADRKLVLGILMNMQTKDDISYGVIPLFPEGDEWKVFLINQFGRSGDIYWTFPKGHKEGDETDEEAALRELKEETDIALSSLNTNKEYIQEYSFQAEDVTINKKVIYYLGVASSKEFKVQADEVKEAQWMSVDEAIEKLTYKKARTLLEEIKRDLGTSMLR